VSELNNCTCGKEVKLHARLTQTIYHRGIAHWIEHEDGTGVCLPGTWISVEVEPYEMPPQREVLVGKWNQATTAGSEG
jgi:hypothetical protein